MTAVTETLHAGGFIISESNGAQSRSTGTVVSGQDLPAGQVVKLVGGKLTAATADSTGALVAAAVGVLFDAVDASTGDVTDCVYLDFGAEVRLSDLTYPDGADDAVVDSLAELFIKAR